MEERVLIQRTILFALVLTLIFAAGSSEALAARPGGGAAKGSLALVLLDSSDGRAHYGQQVTFTVSTGATAYPYVNLKCWQGGAFVGEAWRGFFPTSISGTVFTLSGTSLWVSTEGADCTANLSYQTKKGWMTLASTSFHVDP
jgi:hypothetical protein